MEEQPNSGAFLPTESDIRHSYQLPIRQWQQYSQSKIYKDLGDKAVEYDCAE
jgi:hypothetical protein